MKAGEWWACETPRDKHLYPGARFMVEPGPEGGVTVHLSLEAALVIGISGCNNSIGMKMREAITGQTVEMQKRLSTMKGRINDGQDDSADAGQN